jgi:hypothetical protein
MWLWLNPLPECLEARLSAFGHIDQVGMVSPQEKNKVNQVIKDLS